MRHVASCICDPSTKHGWPYNTVAADYLHMCLYTPLDHAAYLCGMLGILAFVVGFVPQLYKNHVRQSVKGLSFWLVLSWFLGDFANFIGAVLTSQHGTVTVTGLWFCCMSVLTLLQFFYFWLLDQYRTRDSSSFFSILHRGRPSNQPVSLPNNTPSADTEPLLPSPSSDNPADVTPTDTSGSVVNPTPETEPTPHNTTRRTNFYTSRKHESRDVSSFLVRIVCIVAVIACVPTLSHGLVQALVSPFSTVNDTPTRSTDGFISTITSFIFLQSGVHNTAAPDAPICNPRSLVSSKFDAKVFSGQVLAWISGIVYVSGRLPQIIENHKNRSTDALSVLNFSLCIFGNVMYCLSIAFTLPPLDAKFMKEILPYLLGSAGTVLLDLVIIYQAFMFGSLTLQ